MENSLVYNGRLGVDRVNLYWVETTDRAEDWFIVARSKRGAARWHEKAEGYESGDAVATLVLRIPRDLESPEGWPSHELLEACGAKIRRVETPRVVEIGTTRFVEGYLESDIRQLADDGFEALGKGRPNETKRRSVH
ncbi:MAG: hypothetical protein BMS9Abin37_3046 [Acidobacteriota bacterium]|nr:MAG: hypothetical protein BMS9Abin37_3046 [Acidobacteriota bacterium]